MKILRRLSFFSLCLTWLLAACAQSAAPPGGQSTAPPGGQSTAPPGGISPTQTVQSAAGKPGCTVVTGRPTSGPTEEAIIPPPGEEDWIKGPGDAYITLIEYSDFQ